MHLYRFQDLASFVSADPLQENLSERAEDQLAKKRRKSADYSRSYRFKRAELSRTCQHQVVNPIVQLFLLQLSQAYQLFNKTLNIFFR